MDLPVLLLYLNEGFLEVWSTEVTVNLLPLESLVTSWV